ncbi:hypothetical protein M899_1792 [Bacteriovorax sp. BSW11_IV]|uniref:hypothetical protein n=1 Tax=Bacteriovorax sp. BSW11_IV TaxID=1353529 RepID=UPI000389E50A|nr:hypothetical protein [Bacteriovorax sp. BSW11_IV]EQC43649.1 hypothetical protein M899_1792 [Bacteriovorax sp. BSW11_IV]
MNIASKTLVISVLLVSISAFAKTQTILKKKNFVITYDESLDEYKVKDGAKFYYYSRRNYERLLQRHYFSVNQHEYEELRDSLKKFHLLKKLTNPSDEDLLNDAFTMRDQAFMVLDREVTNPCNRKLDLNYKPNVVLTMKGETTSLDKLYNDTFQEKIFNNKEGYILLNDYFKGLKIEEKKDEGISFTLGQGQIYQAHIEQVSDDGPEQTRETVEISGTKFEIRRGQNNQDIYLRVIGKQGANNMDSDRELKKALDDQSLTEVDHDEIRGKINVAAEINLGNRFSLFEDGTNEVVTDFSVGRQVGLVGETEGYTRMRGDIRYRYVQRDENKEEVASVEARIYYDKQYYDSNEESSPYGVEIKRSYKVGENSNFYIEGGLHRRENSADRGKLHWDKSLSIGYEYKF